MPGAFYLKNIFPVFVCNIKYYPIFVYVIKKSKAMTTSQLMQQAKIKAAITSKKMAALELSVWNDKHESELKTNFGFTDKKLANRKIELTKNANA